MSMKEITYAQASNEAMSEEMRRDENVFMMGEDIAEYCGAFGVSRGMLEEFGKERIMNTPIAEQAYEVLYHGKSAQKAIKGLMLRNKTVEIEDAGWS